VSTGENFAHLKKQQFPFSFWAYLCSHSRGIPTIVPWKRAIPFLCTSLVVSCPTCLWTSVVMPLALWTASRSPNLCQIIALWSLCWCYWMVFVCRRSVTRVRPQTSISSTWSVHRSDGCRTDIESRRYRTKSKRTRNLAASLNETNKKKRAASLFASERWR